MAIVGVDAPIVRYIGTTMTLISVILLGIQLHNSTISSIISTSDNKPSNSGLSELNHELETLFNLLESAINEDLVIVKQELLQIKGLVNNAANDLTENFYSLSNNSNEQLRLVNILRSSPTPFNDTKTLSALDDINDLIKKSSANAIRTLQFEDIVTQVSDNSIQYLENLDNFLLEFKKRLSFSINNPHQSSDATTQMKSYVENAMKIRQERQLPDRKAVHQVNLTEGGVELF